MTIQQQGLTPRGDFRMRLQNFSDGIGARLEVRWQPPRFLPPKSSTILMGFRDSLGSGGGKYGTSLGMGTLCRETYGRAFVEAIECVVPFRPEKATHIT